MFYWSYWIMNKYTVELSRHQGFKISSKLQIIIVCRIRCVRMNKIFLYWRNGHVVAVDDHGVRNGPVRAATQVHKGWSLEIVVGFQLYLNCLSFTLLYIRYRRIQIDLQREKTVLDGELIKKKKNLNVLWRL